MLSVIPIDRESEKKNTASLIARFPRPGITFIWMAHHCISGILDKSCKPVHDEIMTSGFDKDT